MKKITLLVALFSLSLSAQTFPSPYCSLLDVGEIEVEEITNVNFFGTVITNTDAVSALIDKTTVSVDVSANQVYTLQVKGDTKGNFDSAIFAFIDWNNNGILNEAGEIYDLGLLTNSTGSDAVSVSLEITVPSTATPGPKRIRITKIYTDEDSPAAINPCAIYFYPFGFGPYAGYGQALDFTLNVVTLGVADFDKNALAVYPVPATDNMTIAYKSAIESLNIYNVLGQQVFAGQNLGTTANVDVSNFTPGTYIAKISSESNTATVKIIKK